MNNLIFDLDDTLYDLKTPFIKSLNKNFPNINVDVEMLFKNFRMHSDEVFDLTQTGEMSIKDMHIYRIKMAMNDLDFDIDDLDSLSFQEKYEQFQKDIVLSEEVMNLLNYCRDKNINMAIITNGEKDRQWDKIRTLNITNWISKENIFVSGELGFSKPDVNIFKIVEKEMDIQSNQSYYVGDSFENDVVGAKEAGWKAIWYNNRNKAVDYQKVKPDYMITEHTQLFSILEEGF